MHPSEAISKLKYNISKVFRGGGVGGINYWVKTGYKDLLHNMGNRANILQ